MNLPIRINRSIVTLFALAFLLFGALISGYGYAATYTTSTVSLTVPTHFDDTWWSYPGNQTSNTSYSIDITPEANGSPDGYFFSTTFFFYNGGTPYNPSGVGFGYMGLQTEESSPVNGNGDIFSIWGSTAVTGAQYTTTFTEGQSGYSARNSYNWVVGTTYNVSVSYLSTDSAGEHWQASVTNKTTNANSVIGEITVPTSFGMLTGESVTFHERFSGETTSCSGMQYSDVKFTDPLMDGSVASSSHDNYQPNVTGCSGDYGVEDIPGGIETAIGGLPPTVQTTVTPTPTPTAPTPTVNPTPTSVSTTTTPTPPPAKINTTESPNKPSVAKSTKPKTESIKSKNTNYTNAFIYSGFFLLIAVVVAYILIMRFVTRKKMNTVKEFEDRQHQIISQPTPPLTQIQTPPFVIPTQPSEQSHIEVSNDQTIQTPTERSQGPDPESGDLHQDN